jgi:hypothetical protein
VVGGREATVVEGATTVEDGAMPPTGSPPEERLDHDESLTPGELPAAW